MKRKYTEDELKIAISNSVSWRQVCLKLNIRPATGSQTYAKKKAISNNIDISHFTGQASSKGCIRIVKKDAMLYCVKGSFVGSHRLKGFLFRDGYKLKECELCLLKEWNNEPIVLELDHIDSDHCNNEYTNLQVLCSNCHAQLTRSRKKK